MRNSRKHYGWSNKNLERSRGTINPDLSEASASLHNAQSLCAPYESIHCSESHIQRAKIVTDRTIRGFARSQYQTVVRGTRIGRHRRGKALTRREPIGSRGAERYS
jgi:hypothetical protein